MTDTPERLINPEARPDDRLDPALRPHLLNEVIGQDQVRENLKILIAAARQRKEAMDHVLFYGPPGLGKTTLAHVLALEMSVNIKVTSGPAIERPGDLAAILTNLRAGDILFVDEIHRLGKVVEEVLYPAMEDYALDIIVGKGPSARSIRLKLPRFTVIGATTRMALISAPLQARFGAVYRLDYYDVKAISKIVERAARLLQVKAEPGGGGRDRPPGARYAACGPPPDAPRARLCAGARRRNHHPRGGPRCAGPARRGPAGPGRGGPPCDGNHPEKNSTAGRWVSAPLARRSAKSRTPSWKWWSRI